MRRSPPTFQPGPLTRTQAEALNQLARDLYGSLLDRFSAAPPLQVRQGLDGVAYSLGPIEPAGGIVTRTTVGSIHSADYGPETRLNFVEGSNIVIGMTDDPANHEIVITITATAPAGAGIEVREQDGAPDYSGVAVLTFDQADGFSLSQPAVGEARLDILPAAIAQAGIVSLTNQSMGAGAKYFNDKIGIGTTSPLANSALDVRGYTYAYFAGAISFGGGNLPASEAAGAILQFTSPSIFLTVSSAAYTAGRVGGWQVEAANSRFAIRHKTAAARKISWYNDDTAAYDDGVTGTYESVTTIGGIVVGGSTTSTITVGSTAVSGGTTGSMLSTDGSGNLAQTSFADSNNVIGSQVFGA
jgi:hypothetical protein